MGLAGGKVSSIQALAITTTIINNNNDDTLNPADHC